MRPAFEKKPLVKRDGQNWREMNKTSPNTSDFEVLSTERDRGKNLKTCTRLQSRTTTVARKDSLPIIAEQPDQTCFSRAAPSLVLSEECNQSLGSRNEKIRICIKRWKKLGSNKSSVSATCPLTTGCHDHFEVSYRLWVGMLFSNIQDVKIKHSVLFAKRLRIKQSTAA